MITVMITVMTTVTVPIRNCYPLLAFAVADDPESSSLCGIYTSADCSRPCRVCLRPYESIHEDRGALRVPRQTNNLALASAAELLGRIGVGRVGKGRKSQYAIMLPPSSWLSSSSSSSLSVLPKPLPSLPFCGEILTSDDSSESEKKSSDDPDVVARKEKKGVQSDEEYEDASTKKRKAVSLLNQQEKRSRRPKKTDNANPAVDLCKDASIRASISV